MYAEDGVQPLCPGVYSALVAKFGQVRIANAGCASTVVNYPDVFTGRSKSQVTDQGEYYRVCCPWCRDTKFRLWVSHMYGQLDSNGRRMTFLAVCYNDQCLRKLAYRRELESICMALPHARGGQVYQIYQGAMPAAEFQASPLPGVVVPVTSLPAGHPAHEYMVRQRKYPAATLDKYNVSFCTHGSDEYLLATGKLIFPVQFMGRQVGWQWRHPGDDWARYSTGKYFTKPGMRKSQLLYNYDNALDEKFVVVVEGVTDVHKIGDNAVALLGSSLSRKQQELLTTTWGDKGIVLLLDNDAYDDMQDMIKSLERLAPGAVYQVRLPDSRDPGDYTMDEIRWLISEQLAAQNFCIRS